MPAVGAAIMGALGLVLTFAFAMKKKKKEETAATAPATLEEAVAEATASRGGMTSATPSGKAPAPTRTPTRIPIAPSYPVSLPGTQTVVTSPGLPPSVVTTPPRLPGVNGGSPTVTGSVMSEDGVNTIKQWMSSKMMSAVQGGTASGLYAAANEIDAKADIPGLPASLRTEMKQAADALRDMAADLGGAPLLGPVFEPSVPIPSPIASPVPIVTPVYTPVAAPAPAPVIPASISTTAVAETAEFAAKKMLAVMTANMLRSRTRGTEDKALVKRYQTQEGYAVVGSADGLYGPKTGLSLVKYDIVPPKPYYWSKTASIASSTRTLWIETMNRQAALDPARKAEWLAAAKV